MIEIIKLFGRFFTTVAFCTNRATNIEPSKLLQRITNRISGESVDLQGKKKLMGLLENGEKKAEQDTEFYLNVNEHLVCQVLL
jgi:hypothetical protein